MKRLFIVPMFLLTANPALPQSAVENINYRTRTIDSSDSLKTTRIDASELYEQAYDGGGAIKIYKINHELVKAKEIIGLSRGRLTTIVFFDKKEEPILIKEVEELFPWDDSTSSFDYTRLDSTFEVTMYLKDKQIIKAEYTGQRSISERTGKISEYESTIEKIKQLANQKEK